MNHVASSPHEMGSRLFWSEHGAMPYFALSKFIREMDGGTRSDEPITVDLPTGPGHSSESGEIHLSYHVGKIRPRLKDSRDPEKGMWELTLRWRGYGERKATYQIKPRWDDMRHVETGDSISTPFDHADAEEGLEVLVQGSNLEPDDYVHVLRESCNAIAEEIGERWSPKLFKSEDILPFISGIFAHERYLRVHRQHTEAVTGSEGVFSKLQQLFTNEAGSHVRFDLDNTEIKGYQNRVELPNHSVEPLPGLEHGCKLEWYHPKKVRRDQDRLDGDALAHPKHEALFRIGSNEGDNLKLNSGSVPWAERHDLVRELEEFLINTLEWCGLDTSPDTSGVFVPDKHFKPVETERRIQVFEDPTPDMEASRESALVRTLMSAKERDEELLRKVVADGGQVHYEEAADEIGSISTVYRALSELDELLVNRNGTLEFVCQKVHEDLREIFSVAKGQVEYAREATERMLRLSDGALENAGGPLRRWFSKYGAEIVDGEAQNVDRVVKLQALLARSKSDADYLDLPWLGDVLEELHGAWVASGFDPLEILDAFFVVPDGEGGQYRGRVKDHLP